jgi:ribonuclease P/MRP protein subunit POP1
MPYFPYDCPGTDAGWGWELHEREVRKLEWTKRPKGKRIEWATIDLGNGSKGEVGDPWACDWERLSPATDGSSNAVQEGPPFRQLSASQAKDMMDGRLPVEGSSLSSFVFAVKITMVQRGAPMDCTRIYRLPTDPELRSKWLSLMPQPGARRSPAFKPSRKLGEPPKLSASAPKAGEDDYPVVPDESDLIGFVTTGNYNLAEGMPTAIGNLAVHKVLSLVSEQSAPHTDRVCIVRQAGSTIGRLAKWEVA